MTYNKPVVYNAWKRMHRKLFIVPSFFIRTKRKQTTDVLTLTNYDLHSPEFQKRKF